jgi:hypothetical protein
MECQVIDGEGENKVKAITGFGNRNDAPRTETKRERLERQRERMDLVVDVYDDIECMLLMKRRYTKSIAIP